MKITIIINTIILILSFIIRNGISSTAKSNVVDFINNYKFYSTFANINAIILICSLIAEVIFVGIVLL
jgi:hypothetical protein